jgi:hypothetical protein
MPSVKTAGTPIHWVAALVDITEGLVTGLRGK